MALRQRPLLFDISHIVSRLSVEAPSGIDRVDMMYARYLAGATPRIAGGTHYGLRNPGVLSPEQAGAIVRCADDFRKEDGSGEADPELRRTVAWLDGHDGAGPQGARPDEPFAGSLARFVATWRFRLTFQPGRRVPEGAIYLNVAQYLFEHPRFFRWLEDRRDVRAVFFVHDLLPLDYPEFFREGYTVRFERRFATIARVASALIVSTEVVRERIAREYAARGLPGIPIHVAPLPAAAPTPAHAVAAETPYFVMIGTIEPRKNHLMLLNVWRELVRSGRPVPRLVIVGSRGWDNEQVLDVLERSSALRPHVLEVTGLTSAGLASLVAGARALLIPSFDEGFGLPTIEALSLGTPVIASDIPVFHEVCGGRATFCHPIDGMGWMSAIRSAMDTPRPRLEPPAIQSADSYFEGVFAYLDSL